MKSIKCILKVILVLGVMACIFYLSSQTATDSRALSHKVAGLLHSYGERLREIVPVLERISWRGPNLTLRKGAHFTIYLVLGLISYLVLPKRWPVGKKMAFVLSMCCLYAITDELHQYFVPGRAMELRDVIIDTVGASVGMSIGCVVRGLK